MLGTSLHKMGQRNEQAISEAYELAQAGRKKNLQTCQAQWLKFRDQENTLIDDVYAHTSGSMFAPMQSASKVRITRDRAILLEHYGNLVNGL